MGICAFRDKNVHFEGVDEKAARVEMVRKYLDRRQTPHMRVVHTASGSSSSDSEDILVEETLERPPPAPLRPPTLDSAVQGDKPEARLSMVTMSLPLVPPTAKDHGTGLGALRLDTVSPPAVLTPPKSSLDEDLLAEDLSSFENEQKSEEKASVSEVPIGAGEVDIAPEDFLQDQPKSSEHEADLPAQVFTLDSPLQAESPTPQSQVDYPPPLEPVEGTEDADYRSQSSDVTPPYHDVPTRTRESHFSEFESPGQRSSLQGLDEAAFVFLRMKSHFLRNPAPLLAPELLERNTQGRLTIKDEEALRQPST